MFYEIDEIRDFRKRYNLKMFQSGLPAFRQLEELEAKVFEDGVLSRKQKELIALAVSIRDKCFPCIEYHVSAAVENGAAAAEIHETVAVAVALGGGTAQWPARFAFKVLEDVTKGSPA
jgi:AhpD family alkylhydroperoxidase